MAHVSIYLNFMGNAEEAFNFYKKVFKTEFSAPIMRMKDILAQPGMPELSENEKNNSEGKESEENRKKKWDDREIDFDQLIF